MTKEQAYYQQFWHKALNAIIRYRHPQVANSEAYSILSLENEPIFFHAEFMKPGKNVFCVEYRKRQEQHTYDFFDQFDKLGEGSGSFVDNSEEVKSNPIELYVHSLLT